MLRVQDYLARRASLAAEEFFRTVRAVPEGRLSWRPFETSRTILEICQEASSAPRWAAVLISQEPIEPDQSGYDATVEEQKTWDTVDRCRQEFDRHFPTFEKNCRAVPDELLGQIRQTPFDMGRDFTYLDFMDMVRWKLDYHSGQVNYLQTAYGDMENH